MTLTHLNPESMHHNPAFSQGVLVEGSGSLLVVGGQNGVDATGQVVSDDPVEQSKQALRNVVTVLESAGCTQADVAKLTIYLAKDVDITAAYTAAQDVWGQHATAISVLFVAALGRPECHVEIEALAQVPAR
jgi:enamine deaminase RidA (YjgF/YER057c/UK114 family)